MARKDFTPEEMKARFDALPPDIKTFVYSSDMDSVIQKIGMKNQLHIDQMALLQAEAGEVMVGLVDSKEFVPNLIESLGVERIKADAIAQDVNDMLFVKIRESMKKVYEQGQATQPTTPPAAPISKLPPLPSATPSVPVPPPVMLPKPPAPPQAPDMHAADMMLREKTITVPPPMPKPAPISTVQPAPAASPAPKVEPPKPAPYKADPYREPIEP